MSNISNIEEIPLEPEAQLKNEEQDIRENEEENENIQEDIQPVEENIQPKKGRGRPRGSLNKSKAPPPPKPKPVAPKPKAKKKQPEPVYEDDSSEDDYQASAPQYDSRQIAAEVLGLLQHQKRQNNMARRSHYASWFQNML